MPQHSFLIVHEVAELLRVAEATVRLWIKSGDLRAIDLGREWRVARSDLDDFLDRHATRPASARTEQGEP